MKGLNKIALVAAIAAASTAQAELVAMDDAAMAATTGQAGLTVDINNAEIEIGAIDYKDQGFITIKDVRLGGGVDLIDGSVGGGIDNIRMTIDVAGDATGLSGPARDTALDLGQRFLGEDYIEFVGGILPNPSFSSVSGNYVDQNITDGDLVITMRAIDSSQMLQSVDFGLDIGSIGLGASSAEVGNVAEGTTLVANLSLTGYLGPVDVIIDGNDGGMNISAYFNAQGSLDMPFMAVTSDLVIHNSRGADRVFLANAGLGETQATTENSVAHLQMNISKIDDYLAPGSNALRFEIQNFEADIDLTDLTLGGSAPIGDVYITDFRMVADTVVYGH